MMDLEIGRLVPRFIMNDKNGYAMAMALEAGMKYFLNVCQLGLDTWGNIAEMPEWRLDELGWEYGLVYDYYADIDTKREWIRDAIPLSRILGTKAGVEQYLKARFDAATVREWWEYEGGQPFHLTVSIAGTSSQENIDWCRRVLKNVMNIRSVLDSIEYNGFEADAGWHTAALVSCTAISTTAQIVS